MSDPTPPPRPERDLKPRLGTLTPEELDRVVMRLNESVIPGFQRKFGPRAGGRDAEDVVASAWRTLIRRDREGSLPDHVLIGEGTLFAFLVRTATHKMIDSYRQGVRAANNQGNVVRAADQVAEENLDSAVVAERIQKILDHLDDAREQLVIQGRLEGKTLQEIADDLVRHGVEKTCSLAKAHRLLTAVLARLRPLFDEQ